MALPKELIELILTTDVLLLKIASITEDVAQASTLQTIRVLFAEYYARHLTDEARAYLTDDGLANPAEVKATLENKFMPKNREIAKEMVTHPATDIFFISFLEGKMIFTPSTEEISREETPNA